VRNEALWKHWYDSDTPEDQKVPDLVRVRVRVRVRVSLGLGLGLA